MTGRGDLLSTVDPSDIRGLGTTGHRSVWELPRSSVVRHDLAVAAHSPVEDSPRTVAAVTHCLQSPLLSAGSVGLREPSGCPEKSHQLARDRCNDFVVLLASADHAAVFTAQPYLGLPSKILHCLGLTLEAPT